MTSLFRKILAVYIGVVVLALGAVSIATYIGVKHYVIQQRVLMLTREAEVITPLLQRPANPRIVSVYRRFVRRDETVNHSNIAIVALTPQGVQALREYQQYFISLDDPGAARAVRRLRAGRRVDFVGRLSSKARVDSVVVGLPIRRHGRIIGVMLLHTPLTYLALGRIARIIAVIALPTIVLSIIVLYLITRRFSAPLISVAQAAEALGQGHFQERVVVQSRDEVGQLAETFNRMAERLEILEGLRRDLIAGVSHELRTPLTSVRGFVQAMAEGVIAPEDYPQYLATVQGELERLNNILSTMLDLSAVESGRMELQLQAIEWNQVVRDTEARVHLRLADKGITFRELSAAKEAYIWVDRDRLTDVLFNLFDNAIRHTPAGGTISVSTRIEGRHLVAEVKDTGEGIPSTDLPHIWERFFKVQTSEQSSSPRTGLGLTITKQLVELMHGRIDVESQVGQGTTFILRFPLLETLA